MVKLEFEISEEAFELLKRIGNGAAEYRDTEHESIGAFLVSDDHLVHERSLEWFKNRNYDGTYHLITELSTYGLVESDGMSWHLTYVLTDFGKQILKNKK